MGPVVAGALLSTITSILDTAQIPSFLAGSRRFGYHNDNSDLDIAICLSFRDEDGDLLSGGQSHPVLSSLMQEPVRRVSTAEALDYSSLHNHLFKLTTSDVHFIVYDTHDAWERECIRHKLLEKALTPEMIKFAATMKMEQKSGPGVIVLSGSQLYKILLRTCEIN